MDDHVETLRRYNRWRRGQDCEEMQDPRVVGDAIDAACDKIDRLRAELAVERKRVSSYRTLVSSLESQISRHRANASEAAGAIRTLDSERAANAVLTAELAECQQDAERYRRLCSLVAWGNFGVCRVQSNEEGDDYADDGDMLDAWLDDPEMIAEAQAIDAAMAGGENGN